MKRLPRIFFIPIITLLALSPCPAQLRGAPNISLTVEQKSIIAERPFSVELFISWDGEPEQYLVENPRLTPPPGMSVTSSSYSTSARGNSHLLHYRYTMCATATGTYVLDPIEISYWERNASGVETIPTDALTVKVSSWAEATVARYRIPAVLVLISTGLFTTVFVLSKKKKRHLA